MFYTVHVTVFVDHVNNHHKPVESIKRRIFESNSKQWIIIYHIHIEIFCVCCCCYFNVHLALCAEQQIYIDAISCSNHDNTNVHISCMKGDLNINQAFFFGEKSNKLFWINVFSLGIFYLDLKIQNLKYCVVEWLRHIHSKMISTIFI